MMNSTRALLINHYQELTQRLIQEKNGQDEELPLGEALSQELIQTSLNELSLEYRDRIFNPGMTLRLFVSQILSADPSCQHTLQRFAAWLVSQNKKLCSTATGAYSQARLRLPIELVKLLLKKIVFKLQVQTRDQIHWHFHQRAVKLIDGTLLAVPDTQENRKKYPKRKDFYGLPLMRMIAVLSLSTGAWIHLETGPHIGKGTGETSLFLKLLKNSEAIEPGDILLMDRLYCTYLILALGMIKGIDLVVRMAGSMKPEKLKTIRKLGKGDRLVELRQTCTPKNSPQDRRLLKRVSKTLTVREISYRVAVRGFRAKQIVLLTTLLDSDIYKKDEIVELYLRRWNCELDLRSIKQLLHLERLSCKSPVMIEKEIWMSALAYNLVRVAMAQAAILSKRKPRDLSFKTALQTLNSFRPVLEASKTQPHWKRTYLLMLQVMSQRQLLKRPGRIEPRAVKRRILPYRLLKVPRAKARKLYWKTGDITLKRNKELAACA